MKQCILLPVLILMFPFFVLAQDRHDGDRHENRGGGGRDMMGEAGSALSVFSENGDRFLLILNGVKQNGQAQTKIRIERLPQVTNEIQIIFDDNRTPAISKRIAFVDPVDGKPVNMTLKIVRGREGRAELNLQRISPLEHDYRGEQGEYIMSYGNDNPNFTDRNNNTIQQAPPPPPPVSAGPTAMDAQSFSDAKQAIAGNSFDDGKLSTAETIANTNYFTTDQVITICKLFAFDDARMTFAKYALKRTIDNNNYYKVNAVFSFDNDKQALNDYVNANR